LTLLAMAVLALPAAAQDGSVSGTVYDREGGALPGVTVSLQDADGEDIGKSTQTDAAGAFRTAFTRAFTACRAALGSTADLGVRHPAGERFRRRRQVDRRHLARRQVDRSRRAQLGAGGQVHLNPHLVQHVAGRVFDRAREGIACSVVRQDQPSAAADGVEGLIGRKRVCAAAFLTACCAALAAAPFASRAVLAGGFAARLPAGHLTCGCTAGARAVGGASVAAADQYPRAEQGAQDRSGRDRLRHQLLEAHRVAPFVKRSSR